MATISPCCRTSADKPRLGIFLSGSGSNAERILQAHRDTDAAAYDVTALVTDRPETSRARELGAAWDVPVVECDIRRFYRDRGVKRITVATVEGERLRHEWTDHLRQQLAPYAIDFAAFAGFVPLTNIAADFPCLNVHPGDLTYEQDGERHLVGLHTIPIERAILAGLDHLRSSVIIVEPFTGGGKNMDAGLILGVSPQVPLDLQGHAPADLQAQALARPRKRPGKGYGDALERVAKANQEALKEHGDWVVFPRVVAAFARGMFASDEQGQLYYGPDRQPVTTVEFGHDTVRPIPQGSRP